MAAIRKNLSQRLLRLRRTGAAVFGDFIYDPGGTHGPRTQMDFQLVYLLSGSAEIRVDESTVLVRPGEACLLQPGRRESFAFAPARPTHHAWCAVRPGALAALPERRLENIAAGTVAVISERATRLLEIAFSIPEEAPAGLVQSVACAMFEEFLFAVETHHADPVQLPPPDAVRRALAHIEAHYAEPLDLARLGRAAGVAPKHLGKLFRRCRLVTPIRHLWRVRTTRGAQLLTETGLSLTEIAERVGFQNPFHLSRLIRREYGVSPSQLRRERWNAGVTDRSSRSPAP